MKKLLLMLLLFINVTVANCQTSKTFHSSQMKTGWTGDWKHVDFKIICEKNEEGVCIIIRLRNNDTGEDEIERVIDIGGDSESSLF